MGSVNFYGRDADTFSGRERAIADMFGADVQAAVANADLGMSSRMRAERAVETLESVDGIDITSGVLAERKGISIAEAHDQLRDAAERADVPISAVAKLLLDTLQRDDDNPS